MEALTIDRKLEIDKAYYFDGTDDYIEVGANVNLQITGDLTISSWINVNGFELGSRALISCKKDNTDNPGTNDLYTLTFTDQQSPKSLF